MRILHTSDWHLGKTLEGHSRLPEQEDFLEELVGIVDQADVHAIVVAGDVYDTVNPPARAEELFYWALERLAASGRRPVVVLAGNHDNPDRLRASRPLAEPQNIFLYGLPSESTQPVRIPIPLADHDLSLAVLPYPSEQRLNALLGSVLDEENLQQAYAERIQELWQYMDRHWHAGCVRMAASHIYMAGGEEAGVERPIQVGGAYTVPRFAVPEGAQYLALGHLHRSQNVRNCPVTARYSGSPLCYGFAEAQQTKSVTIVDVDLDGEPRLEYVSLNSGKPLVRWQAGSLAELKEWSSAKRDPNAWVDVEVTVSEALTHSELQQIRRAHPGILHIRPLFSEQDYNESTVEWETLSLEEHFMRFYVREQGVEPSVDLRRLFLELAGGQEG